ncbi:hypothetical protein RHECNPAF_6420092 [Rhizobium etli CNPAF512]|nr:hypothetical protein RHECNPAF_6420092 [Rhizobium etli CNPAF512]
MAFFRLPFRQHPHQPASLQIRLAGAFEQQSEAEAGPGCIEDSGHAAAGQPRLMPDYPLVLIRADELPGMECHPRCHRQRRLVGEFVHAIQTTAAFHERRTGDEDTPRPVEFAHRQACLRLRLVGRPHLEVDPFVDEVGAPIGTDNLQLDLWVTFQEFRQNAANGDVDKSERASHPHHALRIGLSFGDDRFGTIGLLQNCLAPFVKSLADRRHPKVTGRTLYQPRAEPILKPTDPPAEFRTRYLQIATGRRKSAAGDDGGEIIIVVKIVHKNKLSESRNECCPAERGCILSPKKL